MLTLMASLSKCEMLIGISVQQGLKACSLMPSLHMPPGKKQSDELERFLGCAESAISIFEQVNDYIHLDGVAHFIGQQATHVQLFHWLVQNRDYRLGTTKKVLNSHQINERVVSGHETDS